jgi:hypothetical protein
MPCVRGAAAASIALVDSTDVSLDVRTMLESMRAQAPGTTWNPYMREWESHVRRAAWDANAQHVAIHRLELIAAHDRAPEG